MCRNLGLSNFHSNNSERAEVTYYITTDLCNFHDWLGEFFHCNLSSRHNWTWNANNWSCIVKTLEMPCLSNHTDFKWVHRIFLSSAALTTALSFSHCHARQTTVVADGADLIAATSVSDIKLCAPNWQRRFLHLRLPHANGTTPHLVSYHWRWKRCSYWSTLQFKSCN